ncbi:MAG: thiopurine S-methyltransferase [Cellvibrionaceae bacterium]|nr:thiopurine S-methyltransferase [Cellvibrionaceae bacterium]|tara:strand:- start:234 stop:902 length:669 start_codon:yes stop_codon:yes gene_type:complete
MKADFWRQRWQLGEIDFHESQANPALVDNIDQLKLAPNARLFLPLCGKTLDIAWLLGRGYQVVGIELSVLAIEELFVELGLTPTITSHGWLTHYHADKIDIWVGDVFELTREQLGNVNAVYDRGALVALPLDMRKRYAAHIIDITKAAAQLLVTYQYDQALYAGPPFSLSQQELTQHYAASYQRTRLQQSNVSDGLKGRVDAVMEVWRLEADQTNQQGSSPE